VVRDEIEDSWWPLSFFEKSLHLVAVEADRDAQTMGVAEHAGLRKLIVEDANLPPELELKDSDVLPGLRFDDGNRELSRFTGARVLVEYLQFEPLDGFLPQILKRRFAEISALLHLQKDPDFRALHCLGYINREVSLFRIDLVFETPASTETVTSLLHLIKSGKSSFKPSLGSRFKLCHILAQSLSLFHSVNWIHRAFRSENILFFTSENFVDGPTLDDPKICGFDVCRPENDFSTGPYDDIIPRNVYRHPDRWGTPKKTFTKYHDIYCEDVLRPSSAK
jgi:serine/threonine protein kinase